MSFLSLILVATTIWSDAKDFPFAWAADPFSSNQSYPELASSMLPRALNLSLFLIGDLSPRTLPTGVKPMRISLLRTRELIDLFIFAYPNHDPRRSIVGSNHLSLSGLEHHDNDDLLTALRRDLDQGYEALGLFQDLAHAQVEYNEQDLKAYRKICLSWKSSFLHHLETRAYIDYLSHPSFDSLFIRREHISPFFWGCCDLQPQLNLSGMDNFALLASVMSQDDSERIKELMEIDPEAIIAKRSHLLLHSYRKSLRSLSSLLTTFPDLIRSSSIFPYLDRAFHYLGKVTDGIFAYEFYRKRGKGNKAEAAREEAIEKWRSVKGEMEDSNLEARLAEFSKEVVK